MRNSKLVVFVSHQKYPKTYEHRTHSSGDEIKAKPIQASCNVRVFLAKEFEAESAKDTPDFNNLIPIVEGNSHCSIFDSYNRKLGFKIATGRALSQLNMCIHKTKDGPYVMSEDSRKGKHQNTRFRMKSLANSTSHILYPSIMNLLDSLDTVDHPAGVYQISRTHGKAAKDLFKINFRGKGDYTIIHGK